MIAFSEGEGDLRTHLQRMKMNLYPIIHKPSLWRGARVMSRWKFYIFRLPIYYQK